jgi:hypothetical protein
MGRVGLTHGFLVSGFAQFAQVLDLPLGVPMSMAAMSSASPAEATSATRSAPETWSERVILTAAPKLRAAA